MAHSIESEPDRTDPSTQKKPKKPTYPTVQEMMTWDEEDVLQWVQERNCNILKDNEVDNFKRARFTGYAFLLANLEYFLESGLSRGASLILNSLVNEFKKGKFVPWT